MKSTSKIEDTVHTFKNRLSTIFQSVYSNIKQKSRVLHPDSHRFEFLVPQVEDYLETHFHHISANKGTIQLHEVSNLARLCGFSLSA